MRNIPTAKESSRAEAKQHSNLVGQTYFRKSICAAGSALIVRLAIAGASLVLPLHSALAQFVQQGPKLVGSGIAGSPQQGASVALSADGNTAIVGGPSDGSTGAAWVFTRSGRVWNQQGLKLVGTGAVGNAQQGTSVALSADGNTAIVGGPGDSSQAGAVWIFTRSGGVWTQQGDKLVGVGMSGLALQGMSVAISGDGNTAIVGGSANNNNDGAVWIFTRGQLGWSQQGLRLTGDPGSQFGTSVALSADGNIALVGEPAFNSNAGAVVVFGRSGGVWTVQNGLVGTGAAGAAFQGRSVALSADANTAIVGGSVDNFQGAVWVFIRSGSNSWFQQGSKLVASDAVGGQGPSLGFSVALSADGNTALAGGPTDSSLIGAAWVFTRSGTVWTSAGRQAGRSRQLRWLRRRVLGRAVRRRPDRHRGGTRRQLQRRSSLGVRKIAGWDPRFQRRPQQRHRVARPQR